MQGIVAPAGTPERVINRLNQAINAALDSPEVQKRLLAEGTLSLGGSVAKYQTYIKDEYVRWGEVVKQAGAAVE